MMKSDVLEQELRHWREERARKFGPRTVANDRRTVRVNGREVVIVKKPKRILAFN